MLNHNSRRFVPAVALLTTGLALVSFSFSSAPKPTGSEAVLKVSCPKFLKTRKSRTLQCPCTLKNTGRSRIYVLSESVALEGPRDKADDYVYRAVDVERAENVLRFNRTPRWGLLFRKTIHLDRASFGRWARVEPGASTSLQVLWSIPTDGAYPATGDWKAQLKLVYLDSDSAQALQRESVLPEDCKRDFLRGLASAPSPASLELRAVWTDPKPRLVQDRCSDVVSAALIDVYSEMFTLRVLP
jgi:hypothetical protein